MGKPLQITKASGNPSVYDRSKLITSLERSGASPDMIDRVVAEVEGKLTEGLPTRKIHSMAFNLLRKASKVTAAKYKLKRAIMELGPTGYPFEKFVGEILKNQGYTVETGQILQGQCITHEVDVIARKDYKELLIECKFHNTAGRKSDVRIPLYIHSRFRDLEHKRNLDPGKRSFEGWIVTNTHFTSDAIQYGSCAGLHLIGWNYPPSASLRERIDQSGLHPITCLTTLTKKEKHALLTRGEVLCRSLAKKPDVLIELVGSRRRAHKILREANAICGWDHSR